MRVHTVRNANSWWNLHRVQQGQAPPTPQKTPLCCPFLRPQNKFAFGIRHSYFIVSDNLWLVRWGCRGGFNISRAANSHQQFNIKHSEQGRGLKTQRVSFISPSQPHLPAYLLLLVLPTRTTTANFAHSSFIALTLKPSGHYTWLSVFLSFFLKSDFSILNNKYC